MAVYTDISEGELASFLDAYAIGDLLSYKGIAEGVETRVQMDILQKLHVTELQGYFFSKPVPIAELQAKLAEPRVIKFGQAA